MRSPAHISRRELLAGAGAGAAALLLNGRDLQAQAPSSAVVFTHTTVVNADAVQDDVAVAVRGATIAAIGPTDEVLKAHPGADLYDGRGKALVPGLINCHAHLAATLARGFNEDFGFPNSARLAIQPASLLRGEEAALMGADLFEVMRIALLTERIRRDDPFPGVQPQPEDVLADATQGGARAVRRERALGVLEPGRTADLLVVDTRRPHLVPAGRFLSAWIHNGQPADIESVMVDGRFVMRDRRVLTMDEERIVAEADRVGRRIWGQVEAAGPVAIPRLPRPQ